MAAPARFPAAGTAATPGLGLAQPRRRGEPFRDAEACLVWTIRQLAAEAEAEKKPARAAICSPHEVVKCLDKLYRQRRIDLHHVRILRLWAHRGRAPDPRNPIEAQTRASGARLWTALNGPSELWASFPNESTLQDSIPRIGGFCNHVFCAS